MSAQRQRGMTLMELLVALAVFSLVAAMAYGGLDASLRGAQTVERQAGRLNAVQGALLIMTRDLQQAVVRPVRDNYGESQPALSTAGDGSLALTRGGRRNPAKRARSHLQRVAYSLDGGQLVRAAWPVLDRPSDSEAYRDALLDGVRALDWRFLDGDRQWQEQWPSLTSGGGVGGAGLPLAVEFILELEDWGTLRRLVPMTGWTDPQRGT